MTDKEKQLAEQHEETQENAPEVSADIKKEQEKDNVSQQVETNAADLQKQIAEKLVLANSEDDRKKLIDMQNEIEKNKENQQFLTQKSEELKFIEVKKEDEKPKGRWEKNKEKVWSWFKKTSLATGIFTLLTKVGLGDRVKELKEEKKKDTKETAVKNDAKVESSNVINSEAPVIEAEAIDEATQTEEPVAEQEKQPEVAKGAVKQEVASTLASLMATAKAIDSNFSMFTKDPDTIAKDGQKIDADYQKVMNVLQKIPQLFPGDVEMEELSRATLLQLAEYYTDR